MNTYQRVAISVTSILVTLTVYGATAQASTNQPDVTAEGTAARKATVTWDVPGEVADFGYTIDHWELGISEDLDFTDVDTFTYAADLLSADLTRTNGLRGMKHYYVRVRAIYADQTNSNYGSTGFYTKIGKLDELRVDQSAAVGTVTMKWQKPSREGSQLTYNLRLFRKGKLVYKASVYGKNNITATGLQAGKKYKFKVRARNDSTYGTGKWSDLKSFTVNE